MTTTSGERAYTLKIQNTAEIIIDAILVARECLCGKEPCLCDLDGVFAAKEVARIPTLAGALTARTADVDDVIAATRGRLVIRGFARHATADELAWWDGREDAPEPPDSRQDPGSKRSSVRWELPPLWSWRGLLFIYVVLCTIAQFERCI